MNKRILRVHYVLPEDYDVLDTEIRYAVCGECTRLSYLEGKNRHVRHVYITQSLSAVNCPQCMTYVGLLFLADADL